MSERESLGLTAQVFRPSYAPYLPTASKVGKFEFATYEHVLTTGIGFDSLTVSRSTDLDEAWWWLNRAVGGHVCVEDETGTVVWEGRVNQVDLSAAGLTVSRGPLLDVANRVVVTYQLKNATTSEGQEQKRTTAANNTDSQVVYGICYRILSAGTITTVQANNIRDANVLLSAWPKMPKSLSLGGQTTSVTLNCLGYAHWLNYPYRNLSKLMTWVSAKIAFVLAADPNGFFALQDITVNTLSISPYEDSDRAASEIIAAAVSLGDAAFNRYLFGIWANRRAIYRAAPTQAIYQQRITDKRQIIEDMGGHVVSPWAVKCGEWVTFTSVAPGALVGPSMATMPETERNMFIESVRYTAPYTLALQGGEVNSMKQALAQYGLTGT